MAVNNLHRVLKEVDALSEPEKSMIKEVGDKSKEFIKLLNEELAKNATGAESFVGGSYAKGTFVKSENYDVDIFVRFDWRYDDISAILEKVLNNVCDKLKLRFEKIHGSRDYFKVFNGGGWFFELIPVTKIKKPSEEKNVTDLSYFHVPYVRRKIKGLENQVRLAKVFMKAQKVYGAETYVKGFSGYAAELLIIYYRSFLKMLRELSKVKHGERIVIDIEKYYKKKNEVFIEMNEAKLNSPIILVDPTYKVRNALAALSFNTFYRFQEAAKKFLRSPKKEHFVENKIDVNLLKKKADKKRAEFLQLRISTCRQAGDIAGTKLRKFSDMLVSEIKDYFDVMEYEFDYYGEQNADVYLVLKSKKEVVRIGPPVHLKKFVNAFKREHMNTYEKNKMIHAKIKVVFGAKGYLDVWKKTNIKKIFEMGIDEISVVKN